MRILVDGQCLQTTSLKRGIGSYLLGLLSGLKKISNLDLKVLLNGSVSVESLDETLSVLLEVIDKKQIIYFYSAGVLNFDDYGSNCYEDSEELYVARVANEKVDWLVIPSIFESLSTENVILPPVSKLQNYTKVALISHDLIPYIDKSKFLPSSRTCICYKTCLEQARLADFYICNSKDTEKKTRSILNVDNCVTIYGSGKAVKSQNPANKVSRVERIDSDFIFYFGGLDERKNVQTLISAFLALPTSILEKTYLIIACGSNKIQKQKLLNQFKEKNILFLDFLSEEDLAWFIQNASVCVFPSENEGLGLPIIEIFQNKGRCICSRIPAHLEIYDFDQGLFNPHDKNTLTNILSNVLTDNEFKLLLSKYCEEQGKRFSWEECAKKLIQALYNSKKNNKECKNYKFTLENFGKFRRTKDERINLSIALRKQFIPTIYFDVSNFCRTTAHTGIQRVVGALVSQYGNFYKNHDVVYVAHCENSTYRRVVLEDGKWIEKEIVEPVCGDYYIAIDLVANELNASKKLIKFWSDRGVILVYCIHDIGFVLYPQNIAGTGAVQLLTDYLRFAAQEAKVIVSPSNAVTQEVISWCKNEKLYSQDVQYKWFHLGCNFEVDQVGLPTIGKEKNTKSRFKFLTVSTIEPRKDYALLLDAFSILRDKNLDFEIHIVGKKGWKCEAIVKKLSDKQYCNGKLFWHSNCSDEELEKLYNTSNCFVFTSMYEGFGLPLVEAAHYGLPLMLRDIPVFRELAGEHAIYFKNAKQLADHMKNAITTPGYLVASNGIEALSWQQSATNLWNAIVK